MIRLERSLSKKGLHHTQKHHRGHKHEEHGHHEHHKKHRGEPQHHTHHSLRKHKHDGELTQLENLLKLEKEDVRKHKTGLDRHKHEKKKFINLKN